jgi:hypothetical protein
MKNRIFVVLMLSFSLIAFSSCVTTLQSHKPKSPDEAAVKEILIKWESTWNSQDVQGNLSLWNHASKIKYGKDRKVASKNEYSKILPERMNAVPSIKLGVPKIKLSGNKANAIVNMSMGSYQAPTTYHLVKENNIWSIIGWDY